MIKKINKGKQFLLILIVLLLTQMISANQIASATVEKTAASTQEEKTDAATRNSNTDSEEIQSDTTPTENTPVPMDTSESTLNTNGEITKEVVNEIVTTDPESALEPVLIKPDYEDTTYVEEVSFPQMTLKGIFSSGELFFYVPEYWNTKYIYAELQYDASELIEANASSMTFSINNIPFESCKVTYQNGNIQTTYVAIPTQYLKTGYNSFTISAYARLYNEEGCVDNYSGANWLSIEATSFLYCGYEVKENMHQISSYPYPFVSTMENTGEGLTIAVSDHATNGEIATAMNLMTDISGETEEDNDIQICLLSELKEQDSERTIIISNYENLPEEYKALLETTPQSVEEVIVNYVEDEKGNPLLIISSLNDDCLVEAAYMLMDEDRLSQETSSLAMVNLGSAALAKDATSLSDMIVGNYTIEDIMGKGLTFVGPFHQEQNIYLPVTTDYVLSEAGKVTLNFRYSSNLNFTRSLISVYWGEIPVASKKLEADKASGDELVFTMPVDVIGTTAGSIRIAFDLEIEDLVCTPRQDEMPWAYVSKDSILFLPESGKLELSFDIKSSPFVTDGEFNNVMLLVSDTPTSNELNLLGQILSMYGKGITPYGELLVKRYREYNENDADYNIITTGIFADNDYLQSINEYLDFKYNNNGTRFLSNEQLILSEEYASNIAILQLLESPYAANRGLLAVTGINQDSLLNVEEFLRSSEMRNTLEKDCVIVDQNLTTKAYKFIDINNNIIELTMIEKLVQSKQSLIFTIVATSLMLMMLIAIIIILVRIKMYHRKNNQ